MTQGFAPAWWFSSRCIGRQCLRDQSLNGLAIASLGAVAHLPAIALVPDDTDEGALVNDPPTDVACIERSPNLVSVLSQVAFDRLHLP